MPSSRDEPSDAELIALARGGDATAYGSLVRRHQRAAVRIAAVALGSATDADDIAQEAFVKAHAALGRFREGERFEPWLFRIVTNTARNRQRGQRRHQALTVRAESMAGNRTASPAEIVDQNEDRVTVVDAINRLRGSDRLVLTLRWYDELSEQEIAKAMGCRPGTVKSRLSRAMARLRAELEET